jgi:hypothetical protein
LTKREGNTEKLAEEKTTNTRHIGNELPIVARAWNSAA